MNKQQQPKIVTITLNPALDRTLYFTKFKLGQVNRVGKEQLDPAGKGINVAKVLKNLGSDVAVTGFLGRENADLFTQYFEVQQIHNHLIKVDGATRVNVKIVDDSLGQVTEINFPGIKCLDADLQRLTGTIKELAQTAGIFVLSGSIPEGLPLDVYRELIEFLRGYNCKVFLDTSRDALAEGIKARPYALKPNVDELSLLVGRALSSEEEVLKAIDDLLAGGITKVVVSLGEKGAILADRQQRLAVRPPNVRVSSTVGAGDAMVAGLVYGEAKGWPLIEQARWSTAVAAASVAQPGTQAGSMAHIEQLLPQVIIRELRVD